METPPAISENCFSKGGEEEENHSKLCLGDLGQIIWRVWSLFSFSVLWGGGTVKRQSTQDLEKEFGTYQELYKALFSL